jgi:phage terminase small subunit
MPLRNGLTLKQNNFVKEYLRNGGNGTQAALKTYDTTDYMTAHDIASKNLQKPAIQNTIEEKLQSVGITVEESAREIKSLATSQVEKVSADTKLKANIELLKLLNAYPGTKNTNLNLSLRGNIKDLGYSEAKAKLTELNSTISELTSDDDVEAKE